MCRRRRWWAHRLGRCIHSICMYTRASGHSRVPAASPKNARRRLHRVAPAACRWPSIFGARRITRLSRRACALRRVGARRCAARRLRQRGGDQPAAGGGAGGGMPPPRGRRRHRAAADGRPGRPSCPAGSKPSRVAQVRARAAGIVQKRLFHEGSDVKAGQPLFQIDAGAVPGGAATARRPRWHAPQANLAQAAGAGRALQAAGRGQRDQPAGLRQRRGRAEAGRGRRGRGARPRCRRRSINLGYATVHAPIAGPHRPRAGHRRRAGRPGRGDAAGADPADQPDLRQLHAVGQPTCCACAARSPAGKLRSAATPTAAAVRVVLEDGSEYAAARQAAVLRPDGRRRPRAR